MQLNGARRAFSHAQTATLAQGSFNLGRPENTAGAFFLFDDARSAESANPDAGEAGDTLMRVHLGHQATDGQGFARQYFCGPHGGGPGLDDGFLQ